MSESPVVVHVPARVHLAGNPSDAHDGAVLSTTIPELAAHVAVAPSSGFEVSGPPRRWWTIDQLVNETGRYGHEGGDRLVTAALVAADRITEAGLTRRPGNFEWWTTIPRSVGLGGSSAIVIATMRAAMRWWGVDDEGVDPLVLARAALDAEAGALGIPAGLADRTTQVLGGVVLTDCRSVEPAVQCVIPARPIHARVVWNADAAAPSDRYHRELRDRLAAGEGIADEILNLARLADKAADAVANGDQGAFGAALDASLQARRALGSVPTEALAPAEALRAQGALVNFAGSGGAFVVLGDVPIPRGWSGLDITIG